MGISFNMSENSIKIKYSVLKELFDKVFFMFLGNIANKNNFQNEIHMESLIYFMESLISKCNIEDNKSLTNKEKKAIRKTIRKIFKFSDIIVFKLEPLWEVEKSIYNVENHKKIMGF